jgi:hypothetical protein
LWRIPWGIGDVNEKSGEKPVAHPGHVMERKTEWGPTVPCPYREFILYLYYYTLITATNVTSSSGTGA